ncbi:nuclear transport factor 2 family protein [Burkholderia sp. D-99]|uniref:nuclear transport factor 2 family protein n=1 Tax=unclassified Burkholderia TaxID=2613784 RepID=UPI00142236A3|nr:ester cyclase [Burkholderia sp. D-99]MBZ5790504.1 ester cyclase [Burkholderia contaminans]NHV31119.1 SnoaL-like domain-containing protein [Burkholderia sp. D-99]
MSKEMEEKNIAFVLDALDTLFNKKDYEKAAQFWSDAYIQHSQHVPAGRDGLFGLVDSMPDLRFEYDMVAANGDFVWVHSRYSHSASPVALIAMDILRIENGKLVEHWDVLQNEAARSESAGGYPMFGDRFGDER